MAAIGDPARLRDELRSFLARGPSRAADVAAHLRLSQPAFSRLVASCRDDLLILGRARATRYLALREIADLGRSLPVYEVAEDGTSRRLATLHGVLPDAFYFEAAADQAESGFFGDLPYFMNELRPSGFLGRLVPGQHPELQLPGDIVHWTANQSLGYIARFGWNLSGNLIVGDEAFRRYLANTLGAPDLVRAEDRARRYPELAENVLTLGTPGSSAAGEQPKFLVARTPGPTPVLVKFSPPVTDAASQRIADLLVAESLALEALQAHGHPAARAELVQAAGRVFLEVERFDRLPGRGRRGLISLLALDAQFVGHFRSWVDTAAELARQRRIDEATLAAIRWRHLFGRLIGNTDMHGGNLSFFTRGTGLTTLAPAYDMGPALYAPVQGHVRTPPFEAVLPQPSDAPHWATACAAAHETWTRIAADGRVSAEFRALADANAGTVARVRELQRLLPQGA